MASYPFETLATFTEQIPRRVTALNEHAPSTWNNGAMLHLFLTILDELDSQLASYAATHAADVAKHRASAQQTRAAIATRLAEVQQGVTHVRPLTI